MLGWSISTLVTEYCPLLQVHTHTHIHTHISLPPSLSLSLSLPPDIPTDSPEIEDLYDYVYTEFMEEIDAVDNGISDRDGEPRSGHIPNQCKLLKTFTTILYMYMSFGYFHEIVFFANICLAVHMHLRNCVCVCVCVCECVCVCMYVSSQVCCEQYYQ